MKTRVISGLVMAPIIVGILYFGGLPLAALTAVICFVGITEFFNGWEAMGLHPSKKIAYALITILFIAHFVVGDKPNYLMAWLMLTVVSGMMVGWDIENRGPYDAMATVLGLVYVVFFSYHLLLIDNTDYGYFVWLVIIASFGSDIMAYFTGVLFGKHKLCPHLSPKKTIEGALGGLIGAAFFCGLFGYIFEPDAIIDCIIIGLCGGAFSQAGDLTASAFKRKMGIKDYGHLIPGHGGILDRFDSVIFVSPLVYYYIVLFM